MATVDGSDSLDWFTQLELDGWARLSGSYDDGVARLTAGAHEALLDAAGVSSGTRLLEVGSGSGRLAAAALARQAEVVATDAVAEMVEVIVGRLPDVRAHRATLPKLPFEDAEFDAVVGAFVLNHVADPVASVRELRRVVRPGGRVAVCCWGPADRNRAQGVILDAVTAAAANSPSDLLRQSPFARYAAADGFGELLASGGFDEVGVTEVAWTHHVQPDKWWHDILGGSTLTASLIASQDEPTTARIRAAYDELVGQFIGEGGRAELPALALIATGTRRT